jgi:hypothetical protein
MTLLLFESAWTPTATEPKEFAGEWYGEEVESMMTLTIQVGTVLMSSNPETRGAVCKNQFKPEFLSRRFRFFCRAAAHRALTSFDPGHYSVNDHCRS